MVGDSLEGRHAVVGRYLGAGGSLHRLGHDSRERAAAAHLDLLAREIDAIKPAVGILQLKRTSVAVGVRHRKLPALQRAVALLGFIADETDYLSGLAFESAPETRVLILAGRRTGESKRGFTRFC